MSSDQRTATRQRSLPDDAVITRALRELDEALPPLAPGQPPAQLNVVGGYALIIRGVRGDASQLTDVDYVGADLPVEWREAMDRIGVKHGLGRGWVNNDVQLAGASVDDMELSTGKLEFEPYASAGPGSRFEHFDVGVASEATLLRMKIIAIDTALTAVQLGGDFTRSRDFEDIARFEGREHGSVARMIDEMDDAMLLLDTQGTRRASMLAAKGMPAHEIIERLDLAGEAEAAPRAPRRTAIVPAGDAPRIDDGAYDDYYDHDLYDPEGLMG